MARKTKASSTSICKLVIKLKKNIAKLETLFPNCVTESIIEGKIVKQVDMEMLSRLLQDVKINEGTEKYVMNWPMKNETIRCMKASSKRMLRPIPERSVNYVDTKNIYIEGDNFKAMQILRTHYLGKVKTSYNYCDTARETIVSAFVGFMGQHARFRW